MGLLGPVEEETNMKKVLTLAGIAALLAGCYSTRSDYYPPAAGSSTYYYPPETGSDTNGFYTYSEQYPYPYRTLGAVVIHTNTFGPVNMGPEAALGPGTPSGGTLRETR